MKQSELAALTAYSENAISNLETKAWPASADAHALRTRARLAADARLAALSKLGQDFDDALRRPASDFDEQLAEYDERDAERAERFETFVVRMRRERWSCCLQGVGNTQGPGALGERQGFVV